MKFLDRVKYVENGTTNEVYSPDNPPTKSVVGLGNVDNVKQYSASNPPPYPVTSVNGKIGAVSTSPTIDTFVVFRNAGSNESVVMPNCNEGEIRAYLFGVFPRDQTTKWKIYGGNTEKLAAFVGPKSNIFAIVDRTTNTNKINFIQETTVTYTLLNDNFSFFGICGDAVTDPNTTSVFSSEVYVTGMSWRM